MPSQPVNSTLRQPKPEALFEALARAVELYRDPPRLAAVQARGMKANFGWTTAAARFERLFEAP